MTMTGKQALVLGATGGIGGSIAGALLRHGWQVRGMARQVMPSGAGRIDWVRGDAMQAEDVARAARGVSVIVHAVNPPNYRHWDRLVLPMIENTIAAARAEGARILLPGTIYNFDPARVPVISERSPQQPHSRKGRIRVALEARLRAASQEVPVLVLRAGDFFGPGSRSSWFSQAMIRPGRPLRRIVTPARGPGHSWAYLPDLAEAAARLLDQPGPQHAFEEVQFAGFQDTDGHQMVEAIRRVAGRDLPVIRFPWWALRLAAPFAAFPREAAEIAPYWRHPVRLDNHRLEALIGPEPRTPLDDAIRVSLAELGCLPQGAQPEVRTA
ncbi:NAD-dependent epimerase/dehydratase family protein [Oceanicola sp. S124]|uniref:NAD-dependent epimerase/dehydratase family protein n=1 Tax=Oceanicola sp. S124 TaxID=1042378 RepID=UPI00031FB8A3|nr:NAD-dependent epimerase/dehydratase family protein [Oceanicola sp. S124]